jgi:hypothetical protein
MFLRSLATAACCAVLTTAGFASMNPQMGGVGTGQAAPKPVLSPPATAEVSLNGKQITIHYSSPRLKGRKVGGEVAPYGKVWRTGANPATTLVTAANLKIGTLGVPAGTYTIFTLPGEQQWIFIVSKKTGEWGIPYPEGEDLGRTPMTGKSLPNSQEDMSISFEHTHGSSTELHVKWATTDQWVEVHAE